MKPTVGRVVHWYRPESVSEQKWTETGVEINQDEWREPVAAIIIKLSMIGDRMCRMQILDPWTHKNYSVTAMHSDEPKPGCWSWPAEELIS